MPKKVTASALAELNSYEQQLTSIWNALGLQSTDFINACAAYLNDVKFLLSNWSRYTLEEATTQARQIDKSSKIAYDIGIKYSDRNLKQKFDQFVKFTDQYVWDIKERILIELLKANAQQTLDTTEGIDSLNEIATMLYGDIAEAIAMLILKDDANRRAGQAELTQFQKRVDALISQIPTTKTKAPKKSVPVYEESKQQSNPPPFNPASMHQNNVQNQINNNYIVNVDNNNLAAFEMADAPPEYGSPEFENSQTIIKATKSIFELTEKDFTKADKFHATQLALEIANKEKNPLRAFLKIRPILNHVRTIYVNQLIASYQATENYMAYFTKYANGQFKSTREFISKQRSEGDKFVANTYPMYNWHQGVLQVIKKIPGFSDLPGSKEMAILSNAYFKLADYLGKKFPEMLDLDSSLSKHSSLYNKSKDQEKLHAEAQLLKLAKTLKPLEGDRVTPAVYTHALSLAELEWVIALIWKQRLNQKIERFNLRPIVEQLGDYLIEEINKANFSNIVDLQCDIQLIQEYKAHLIDVVYLFMYGKPKHMLYLVNLLRDQGLALARVSSNGSLMPIPSAPSNLYLYEQKEVNIEIPSASRTSSTDSDSSSHGSPKKSPNSTGLPNQVNRHSPSHNSDVLAEQKEGKPKVAVALNFDKKQNNVNNNDFNLAATSKAGMFKNQTNNNMNKRQANSAANTKDPKCAGDKCLIM
jgi:hypothetical protein